MAAWDEDNLDMVCEDIRNRQRFLAEPKQLADVISRLMARRGYAQQKSNDELRAVWAKTVGMRLAADSLPGNVRAGVLEIYVRNSSVLQELTFVKRRLLKQFNQNAEHQSVRDFRFRVGVID